MTDHLDTQYHAFTCVMIYIICLLSRNPDSGSWRGVRISDGILRAPPDGWGGNTTFVVVGSVKEKKEREQERGDRESSRESGGMGERIGGKEMCLSISN